MEEKVAAEIVNNSDRKTISETFFRKPFEGGGFSSDKYIS